MTEHTQTAIPDELGAYEFEAEPFTTGQRAAIAAFEERMGGLLDCYDSVHYVPGEFTPTETESMIRSDFDGLSRWYCELDTLKTDLGVRGASHNAGTAAARYFARECTRWYAALHTVRREACRYAFGTAGPEPEVDSGHLTFFDIPGVELTGCITAEST